MTLGSWYVTKETLHMDTGEVAFKKGLAYKCTDITYYGGVLNHALCSHECSRHWVGNAVDVGNVWYSKFEPADDKQTLAGIMWGPFVKGDE